MRSDPPSPAAAGEATTPGTFPVDPARVGRRRRGRRWRRWGIVLMVVIGLRLALPIFVAPIVAERLSRALGAQVTVGDVSLQPLDAIVTLRNVTVSGPARAGAAESKPPLVADRVRLDVQWLPLMHQTLHMRELRIESGRVELDRFADGEFGLANLERADPVRELPAGWSFALDRIAFRDTDLTVHDLAAGGSALVQATLRSAEIAGLRQRATAFGKSNNVRVDARLAGGELRVRGRYDRRDDGVALDLVLRVKDVPLAQAKSYVSAFGWSDVWGEASGMMRWQREPRRRDLLSGRLVLRRGGVRAGALSEPALAVRGAVAEIAAIDLLRRRIAVRSLVVRGATLAVQPDASAPLPLFTMPLAPPGNGKRGTADPRAATAAPWTWIIERFDTDRARVRVLNPEAPFDLRARATAENLGPEAYWSPLRMSVDHEQIALTFEGTAKVGTGLLIEGRMTAAGIDFPAAARAARLPWADLVHSGAAGLDLTVQFDTRPPAGKAPLYVRGGIGLIDVRAGGDDPGAFAFSAASIALTLDDYALLGTQRAAEQRPPVTFSHAELVEPQLFVLRSDDGWIVPPPAQPVDGVAPEVPRLLFGELKSEGGRLMLIDLVPAPPVRWSIGQIAGTARNLTLPGLEYDAVQLRGSDPRFGGLSFAANRGGGLSQFELGGRGVPLAATTPYLALGGLPYRFAGGRGSFTARGSLGAGGWSTDALLTLQGPEMAGSLEALESAFGMPLPAALTTLRDPNGDVVLQLAVAANYGDGAELFTSRVGAGLRGAIARAKDAQLAAAELAKALQPRLVPFDPGQSRLSPAATRALASLADMLAARPELVIELHPATSAADRRWLAEQALAPELAESGGFRNMLRAIGVSDERARISAALAARARGELGPLDADDEAALTRMLVGAPPVDDAKLEALRQARLASVTNQLADVHRLTAPRVSGRDTGDDGTSLAAVRVLVSLPPPPPPPVEPGVLTPAAAAVAPPPRPPATPRLD